MDYKIMHLVCPERKPKSDSFLRLKFDFVERAMLHKVEDKYVIDFIFKGDYFGYKFRVHFNNYADALLWLRRRVDYSKLPLDNKCEIKLDEQ